MHEGTAGHWRRAGWHCARRQSPQGVSHRVRHVPGGSGTRGNHRRGAVREQPVTSASGGTPSCCSRPHTAIPVRSNRTSAGFGRQTGANSIPGSSLGRAEPSLHSNFRWRKVSTGSIVRNQTGFLWGRTRSGRLWFRPSGDPLQARLELITHASDNRLVAMLQAILARPGNGALPTIHTCQGPRSAGQNPGGQATNQHTRRCCARFPGLRVPLRRFRVARCCRARPGTARIALG